MLPLSQAHNFHANISSRREEKRWIGLPITVATKGTRAWYRVLTRTKRLSNLKKRRWEEAEWLVRRKGTRLAGFARTSRTGSTDRSFQIAGFVAYVRGNDGPVDARKRRGEIDRQGRSRKAMIARRRSSVTHLRHERPRRKAVTGCDRRTISSGGSRRTLESCARTSTRSSGSRSGRGVVVAVQTPRGSETKWRSGAARRDAERRGIASRQRREPLLVRLSQSASFSRPPPADETVRPLARSLALARRSAVPLFLRRKLSAGSQWPVAT